MRLLHTINEARETLAQAIHDIHQNQRLYIRSRGGHLAAFAHYLDQVPASKQEALTNGARIAVVFEVEDARLTDVRRGDRRFARLDPSLGSPYVSIKVLGFLNAPDRYPVYDDAIYPIRYR